jgi:hypothetical protein
VGLGGAGGRGRRGRADDGLRAVLRAHLGRAQWTSVETPGTGRGTPDCEYCLPGGVQGWVECKAVRRGWAVKFKIGQVAWHLRRARVGGRSFIAVRRRIAGWGDELWLVPGRYAGELEEGGLKRIAEARFAGPGRGYWEGGPSKWDWEAVARALAASPASPCIAG